MENLSNAVEIMRLGRLASLFSQIMDEVKEIKDKKEYDRVRSYLDSRFDIELPYTSPFIKEVK